MDNLRVNGERPISGSQIRCPNTREIGDGAHIIIFCVSAVDAVLYHIAIIVGDAGLPDTDNPSRACAYLLDLHRVIVQTELCDLWSEVTLVRN